MAERPEAGLDPSLPTRGGGGQAALALMERQLAASRFLTGDTLTAADLCLLPSTRAAPEGGFDLTGLTFLNGWKAACAGGPGVAPLPGR